MILSFVSNFIPNSDELETGVLPFISGIFIFILPIFYAVIGSVINVIVAAIYNLISKKFGGIKFELKNVKKMKG